MLPTHVAGRSRTGGIIRQLILLCSRIEYIWVRQKVLTTFVTQHRTFGTDGSPRNELAGAIMCKNPPQGALCHKNNKPTSS